MFRIKKAIEYGLYLLVFLLPFQTRWIISQGEMNGWPYEFGTLSLYATDILLLILIALNAWVETKKLIKGAKDENKIPIVWWLIAGIELATFISIFFAPDKIIAGQFYLRLLLGIGLFWIVISASYNREKLINVFVASAVAQAMLGIWQFFIQATFANKFLGMAKHLPADIGASVITTVDSQRWLRAYGSLDHPNIFGGMIAIALLLFLTQITKRSWWTYAVTAVLSAGLFFSFSRAAWIGFGVGLLVFFVFDIIRRRANVCSPSRMKSIGVVIIIFILLSGVYFNLISARTTNNTVTENKSVNDRLQSYQVSGQIIKNNWLVGVGAGNYGLAVKNEFNDLDYNGYQPMHNVFLLIYSEIGILGLVSFCSLIIYLVWQLTKIGESASISIVISMVVIFLLDHWLWSLHFGLLFLWLLLGILYLKSTGINKKIEDSIC